MKRVLCILFCSLVVGCGYDRFGPPHMDLDEPPFPNVTIAQLRSQYGGVPLHLAGSGVVFAGCVTSCDRAGNFSRSIVIEDGTGAIEIMAGLYDLHSAYPRSQTITVIPDSLVLGMRNGMLQIGLPSIDGYNDVGYMQHRLIVDRHLFRSQIYDPVVAVKVNIGELSDEMMGCLVRIEGMVLDSLYENGTLWEGDLKFRTSLSDSIYVTTSQYATFASEAVPRSAVAVTGILCARKQANKLIYQIKMRDLADVEQD